MPRAKARIRILSLFTLLFCSEIALAELGINFPTPAAPVAQEIYDVHMLTMRITTVLLIIVFSFILYSIFFHRKSRGYQADQHFHETWFGNWSWIFVPAMVLAVDLTIANSAQKTLEKIWVVPKDEKLMDLKVIGHQWWWEFEYLDHDIKVESRYTPEEKAGDLYLREVDKRLVLPTNTRIRFLHTSADVLHAFWVPELGFKKDAIPGYVTETWAEITREGVFRGQCAELCGTWHSRMPLVVEAVSQEQFNSWVEEQKTLKVAALAEASADKVWSKEDLFEKGKGLYNSKCSACHQITGLGLPPAFPALKGSPIATGSISEHLKIVLNGKEGTAMQPWNSLNDLEIASIITYERNAWGNDTGDVVQPADVKAAR
jgi:cytochrome c oxidase subunit 2